MTTSQLQDLRSRCHGVSLGMFAADPGRLHDAASQAASWGAGILHFDVMDGVFVPALTGGPAFVKSLDIGLVRDVHLMVDTPSQHIAAFADAGADIITIHAEANDAAEAIATVRAARGRLSRPLLAGLALMPGTTLEVARPLLALEPDVVLVVSLDPRKSGGADISAACAKISDLAKTKTAGQILAFDGGVTEAAIEEIAGCRPDIVVSGSAVFSASAPARALRCIGAACAATETT